MLVTFTTPAYADITMFGDVALSLLKMMGHSATVPGALLADDIAPALERLKTGVAGTAAPAADTDDDEAPPVSLAHRALPLIQLLEAAAKSGKDVMWK